MKSFLTGEKTVEKYIQRGTKKFLKNRKGMSLILAALLLVVIVVVMAGMVYAWSSGLLGGLMTSSPQVGESISMDAYTVDTTNDNATLFLRNIGDKDIGLVTYYITNPTGVTSQGTWVTQPTIAVNSVQPVTIPETGAYSAGFDSGYSYTVKLITTSGNQFVFTVRA